MPDATQSPVLFLAFSSIASDYGYLPSLAEEAKALRAILEAAEARGQCQVVIRENVTLAGLLDVFQDARYRDRIVLFHYAGHASAYELLLEQAAGRRLAADADGFAAFLAGRPELKFVFLNGCATAGHVAALHATGVPAVLAATSEVVHDEAAWGFAARFYQGLAGGATLRAAYAEAVAEQQMLGEEPEPSPWQLFAGEAQSLDWHLPPAGASGRVPRGPLTRREQRLQANCHVLRQKVANFWIGGVYEQSIRKFSLVDLDIEVRPDLVEQPFGDAVRLHCERRRITLARLVEIYDESNGSLLIAGEPGAGKTTALLALAKALLARAERDPPASVPIVFNLSSWRSDRHRSFEQWLMRQMQLHYRIGGKPATELLDDNRLVLLLDGLDEVTASERESCTQAVERFQQERSQPAPLVVCSRLQEYLALTRPLRLDAAILLKPLGDRQIAQYLAAAGPQMAPLAEAVSRDSQLLEMMSSPLMLNVMAASLGDPGAPHAPDIGRRQLFAHYVASMFARAARTERHLYAKVDTVQWLAWLAHNMQLRSISIFAIEGLQPDWLASAGLRRAYAAGTRLVLGLVLLAACMVGVGLAVQCAQLMSGDRSDRLAATLAGGGAYGLLWAAAAILASLMAGRLSAPVAVAVTMAGAAALCIVIVEYSWFALLLGALFGLPAAMAGLKLAGRRAIVLADLLRWSWRRGAVGFAAAALAGAALTWLVEVVLAEVVGLPLGDLLAVSLLLGVVGMLGAGLTSDVRAELRSAPDEGFRRAARNSVGVAAAVMLVLLAVGVVSGIADHNVRNGLTAALALGLPVSASLGLWAGGSACIQHMVLRFLLHKDQGIPYNLARFLDAAVDKTFLRRVGGSYIFMHRLLLEYFAVSSQMGSHTPAGPVSRPQRHSWRHAGRIGGRRTSQPV